MEEKITKKRIVSKGEYVKAQIKRSLLFWGGAGYYIFSIGCAVFCAYLLAYVYSNRIMMNAKFGMQFQIYLFFLKLILSLTGAIVFWLWGRDTYKQAQQVEPGVPLTRANTAILPAPDSLVRPSTEPLQQHRAILLRVAEEGQKQHEEQLVRAVSGQEEP